ncbi:MAG: hypothetical protein ACRCWJ_19715 [Casimicrobium sp.]
MSRLTKFMFAVLLLVVALIVLVWRLPASAVLMFAPTNTLSSPFAKLHRVNGTLWQGEAIVSTALTPNALPIAWRCAPTLSSLGVDCAVSGALSAEFVAKPFAQTLEIRSLTTKLAVNFNPNAAVAVGAQSLDIQLKPSQLSRQSIALTGSATAKDANFSTGNTPIDLGEVFVDCAPANQNTSCTIKNRTSAARLDGSIALTPSRASGTVEFSAPTIATQKINF